MTLYSYGASCREILFLVNFAATVSSAFCSDLMNGRALFYNSGNFLLSQKEYLKVLPEPFAGLKRKSFLNESIIMSSNMLGMCD